MENNITETKLTPKEVRQLEVDQYKANIETFKSLLETLDGNWDDDLINLKELEIQEAARQCPMDKLARLAVLQQYDQVLGLLKTETVECAKAQAILNIL
jgi:hypothetical protein